MTKKGLKRKLTAILSADVEGYSRVMGYDEAKGRPSTIASLGQKVMKDHGGSIKRSKAKVTINRK